MADTLWRYRAMQVGLVLPTLGSLDSPSLAVASAARDVIIQVCSQLFVLRMHPGVSRTVR